MFLVFLRPLFNSCCQCASRWKHIQDNGARGLQMNCQDELSSLDEKQEYTLNMWQFNHSLVCILVHIFGRIIRKTHLTCKILDCSQVKSEHTNSSCSQIKNLLPVLTGTNATVLPTDCLISSCYTVTDKA